MMHILRVNSSVVAICSLIILFNISTSTGIISLNVTPTDFLQGETATFSLDLIPNQDLSNVELQFFVDSVEVGKKKVLEMEKDKSSIINFDYYFDKDSYKGEHYLELRINSMTSNGSYYVNFLKNINVIGKIFAPIWQIMLMIYLALLIVLIYVNRKIKNRSIIKLGKESRKSLIGLVVVFLPIVASYFLSIMDKTQLKVDISTVLLCYLTSFVLIIWDSIKYETEEDKSSVKANNLIVYSILFLLLGHLNILFLLIFK